MTPKEKANELMEKYYFVYIQNYTSMSEVKQCALMAIDEIIENLEFIHKPEYVSILIQGKFINIYESLEYWQEVKQQIEKM